MDWTSASYSVGPRTRSQQGRGGLASGFRGDRRLLVAAAAASRRGAAALAVAAALALVPVCAGAERRRRREKKGGRGLAFTIRAVRFWVYMSSWAVGRTCSPRFYAVWQLKQYEEAALQGNSTKPMFSKICFRYNILHTSSR